MIKKEKTMNLETYLETNNFNKNDLTILFSVGCVLNTKTGDTFPMMADDTFDFEDGMNVVTDEFDVYWWENLGKWKPEERLVLETIENINDEPYDHSIDTIDPDESELPGPNPNTYGYNDTISDEEVDWLESKVELSLGI
tara:strand:- start:469 stop:888 length:420 start_codon:yes stop_codon:yes gene_type:complete